MFCATCGHQIVDGAHFCESCGAQLQTQGAVVAQKPVRGSSSSSQDPYKDQIADLRLQLKQLKLYLKQTTTKMSNTRANFYETSAFVPHGLLKHGYKWFEDFRLWGPQRQKQHLQDEIMQLEQQLLGLQQAQTQWKRRDM